MSSLKTEILLRTPTSESEVVTKTHSSVWTERPRSCSLARPRWIALSWLWLVALGFFIVGGSKSAAQSITLAPPTSSTTYVDSLSVSYSITGDSSAQSVQVVWTYTSGNSAYIGNVWTLSMKTPSLSQTFTLKPTDLTNSANAFTASPTTSMPEGFYSVYAQYVRPASAGSLTVRTTTRTNVYLDLYTQTPIFPSSWAVTVNTTTDVISFPSHGLTNNTPVTITGTDLSSATTYYVSVIDSNSIKLATTPGGTTYADFTTSTAPKLFFPPLTNGTKYAGTTMPVRYTFPEFYLSGSAHLIFSGPATVNIVLVDNVLNADFTLDRTNISNPTYIQSTSASTLPDGSYTVTLQYQDRYSHPVASVVATNVVFDSGTQMPSFTNLADNGTIVQGSTISYTLPEAPLTGTVSLTFNNGTTSTVVPLTDVTSGTFTFNRALYAATIPTGVYSVTLSYQDAAGNPAATASVTGVSVTVAPISNTEDSDGDGLNDAAEIALAGLGFDWQVAQPTQVTAFLHDNKLYTQADIDAARAAGQADVTSNPTAYSLYSLTQLQNLQVGTPVITKDTVTGKWKITITLQKSTDLVNYTAFPFDSAGTTVNSSGQVEFLFTVPENNAFFRLSTSN